MLQWLKKWHRDRLVKRSPFSDKEWEEIFQILPVLHRLNPQEKTKLKHLAILFLHYKSLETIGELELTSIVKLVIALQACLPILNLGLDWYTGWVSVIIYPGAFSKPDKTTDQYGIVHEGRAHLSGESWQRGPVILSWEDALYNGEIDGRNVVIHEFAHKLDMLNGSANGHPPLHKGMSVQQWSKTFSRAFADFKGYIAQGYPTPFDSYGAESPGEFFAVCSEIFFEKPFVLKQSYNEVYELLVKFYRQDPLRRDAVEVFNI